MTGASCTGSYEVTPPGRTRAGGATAEPTNPAQDSRLRVSLRRVTPVERRRLHLHTHCLRDGEAAGLDYKPLQRLFGSQQVSVWVSVRRRTAAPRRLQRFLNSHVSASRDAPERAKAELESERPARDRGFESPRFRSADQQERRSGAPPSAPPCWAGSQLVWVSAGPHSSPVPQVDRESAMRRSDP